MRLCMRRTSTHAKTSRWGDSACKNGLFGEPPIATERSYQLIYSYRENKPLRRFRMQKMDCLANPQLPLREAFNGFAPTVKTGSWGDSACKMEASVVMWRSHRALLREAWGCGPGDPWLQKVLLVGILVKDWFRSKNSLKKRTICEEHLRIRKQAAGAIPHAKMDCLVTPNCHWEKLPTNLFLPWKQAAEAIPHAKMEAMGLAPKKFFRGKILVLRNL